MYRKVFVLLAVLSLSLHSAGDEALDRATLRGVKAVNVVADPVAPELEKEGATSDALRTRLEQKLRDGGIEIDSAALEFVGLRITSVRAARGPLAITADIAIYQPVTLVRDRTVKTTTKTWEADTIVLADTKQVYRACMDSMDELAGRFVTAYRSVNPQKGSDRADK
ncbi:MAG: hypothetical protein ABI759_09150 [Candidatus Solibacter sp.]